MNAHLWVLPGWRCWLVRARIGEASNSGPILDDASIVGSWSTHAVTRTISILLPLGAPASALVDGESGGPGHFVDPDGDPFSWQQVHTDDWQQESPGVHEDLLVVVTGTSSADEARPLGDEHFSHEQHATWVAAERQLGASPQKIPRNKATTADGPLSIPHGTVFLQADAFRGPVSGFVFATRD